MARLFGGSPSCRRTNPSAVECMEGTDIAWDMKSTRQYGPRRARITFSDAVVKHLEAITSEALDRALVVVSAALDIGKALPGDVMAPLEMGANCGGAPWAQHAGASAVSRGLYLSPHHLLGDPVAGPPRR